MWKSVRDGEVLLSGGFNNHYSIYLQQGGEGWYIADNTVVGGHAGRQREP